jgi:nicotinamidase-related amidase
LKPALLLSILYGCLIFVSFTSTERSCLILNERSLAEISPCSDDWIQIEKKILWDPCHTALIICDMWDAHHCKKAEKRVREMAPRIQEFAESLRKKGGLIIHCPADTRNFYKNFPQLLPKRIPPKKIANPIPLPIDDSDGGCDDEDKSAEKIVWTRQIESIEICDEDIIADSYDLLPFLQEKGVTNVMILGVHANKCILTRPYGIISLLDYGFKALLVRDLTDAMYNPMKSPYVNHFTGNDLVIWYIEKHWCPTITSDQILGGQPFHFSDDLLPQIEFGDYGYLLIEH